MKTQIIVLAGGCQVLEVYNEHYEYYVKTYDSNDFEYKFGVEDRFTAKQLTALLDAGYFDN